MAQRELDDLRTKIHSFRVSDLQTLISTVGRSRNGKKQELQNRALEILRTQPSDVNINAFKSKIHELYRLAQEEAKQSHYEYPPQRAINQGRAPNPYVTVNPYTVQPQSGRPANNAIVYQNGSIVGGNSYPNTNMYPAAGNTPSIQPPSVIACNLGNTVRIISPSISPAPISFRSLPFYKVKHEILKPTILKLKTNGNRPNTQQLFQISFVLTCDIASDIAMHRDITKNEYKVQAQLRICALDNNNATTDGIVEYDDLLPLGLYVRMNDKQCALPPCSPCTRPNVEARRIPLPINVTQFMKLSPMNVNKLTINWTPEVGRTFVISLNVVEKLSSTYLLEKLKERPSLSVDITKQTIAKQYKRVIDDDDDDTVNADDDDIATTIVRVSLQCPLAKFRMMYPAKGRNCSHLQCFDGFAYISCNEKKSVWMCPVCNRSLYYDDLLIDQYFVDVLASEQSADCQEVQLFVDGSWKVYDEENATTDGNDGAEQRNSLPNSPSENLSLTSSGDNSNDVDRKTVLTESVPSTVPATTAAMDPVVDLTMEDDDDNEDLEKQGEAEKTTEEERPRSEPSVEAEVDCLRSEPTAATIENSPGEVGGVSLPDSPELASHPATSPVPISPAPVSSTPGSPVIFSSQPLSSQEEVNSASTNGVNPMVMSPSPSPDAKRGESQEVDDVSFDVSTNDAPSNETHLDDAMEDTPVDDVTMDDSPIDGSSTSEPSACDAQENNNLTNGKTMERWPSNDIRLNDTPTDAPVSDTSADNNVAHDDRSAITPTGMVDKEDSIASADIIDKEDSNSSTAMSALAADSPNSVSLVDSQPSISADPSSPPPFAMAALNLDDS